MKKTALLGVLAATVGVLSSVCAFADTGTANTTMTLVVPVVTTVSCSSASVTAPAGTQTNTLTVICTLTGNPNNLTSGTANQFTAATATMTNQTITAPTLTATRQNTVTSPDGSINAISGTAAGFTGTMILPENTTPVNTWKVQATYTVPTTSTTPAGTYTSSTIPYVWSTL